MKEKYSISKDFILAKAEDKGSVTLFTLLDSGNFKPIVAVGNKVEGIELMSKVTAKIDITIESKRLELKDGKVEFLEVARKFVDKVELIKDK